MAKRQAGEVKNELFKSKHKYARESSGDIEVVSTSIKYRHGELRKLGSRTPLGNISKAIAELKENGFEIVSVNTAHANGMFMSFFITTIIASRKTDLA